MRVLFTSTPGLGHFYPLVPLARAARAAGDEVRIAIGPEGLTSVTDLGFDAVPTAEPAPQELGRFWAALEGQPEPNTYVIAGLFARLRARAALADTRSAIEEFPEPRFAYHNLALEASDIPNTITADLSDCRDTIPDESFDLVLSSGVLPHIDRPWLAASEIGRILKDLLATARSR